MVVVTARHAVMQPVWLGSPSVYVLHAITRGERTKQTRQHWPRASKLSGSVTLRI
jgi:hypothetical protein